MKVQAKMEIKDHYNGMHYNPQEDDILTVPDELGANWVINGWAKNIDTGEDNAPSSNPTTLSIDNSKLGLSDTGL